MSKSQVNKFLFKINVLYLHFTTQCQPLLIGLELATSSQNTCISICYTQLPLVHTFLGMVYFFAKGILLYAYEVP